MQKDTLAGDHALPSRRGLLALPVAAVLSRCPLHAAETAFQSDVAPGGPRPWTAIPVPKKAGGFSFTVFGDRTGMAYPEGIERALAKAQGKDQSEFVISVGDNVEGYNRDAAAVTRMWEDFAARIRPFDKPFFRLPGNHDLSNPVMLDVYTARYGRPYYYFLYQDVLFLSMSTEDPPGTLPEAQEKHLATTMDSIMQVARLHPDRVPDPLAKLNMCDPDAPINPAYEPAAPTRIGPEQVAYFESVLSRFANVRWTFVLMHRPAWRKPQSAEFAHLQKVLGDRNYTVFAGHLHKYKRESIGGHEYYTLGPTAAIPRCADSADDFNQIVNVNLEGARPVIQREMLVPAPSAGPAAPAGGAK